MQLHSSDGHTTGDLKPQSVLAIDAWDAGSHQQVRQSIDRHGRLAWTWIGLKPVPWRWRHRLGVLEAISAAQQQGHLEKQWDCIVVTSLLPVGELRGALPSHLRSVPIVLLMHENQVAYPAGHRGADPRDDHAPITDLTSLAAADAIVWTSVWNQRSCRRGLERLLARAPGRHWTDVLEDIDAHSTVWWPPVEDPLLETAIEHNCDNSGRSLCIWPHRHQPDKGPAALLALARRYSTAFDLQWALLGERRGPTPVALTRFRADLEDRLVVDDFVPRADLLGWLAAAQWVVSTAKHEFFGIAVVEALLCGCLPWLPSRLSYPELLPDIAKGLHPGIGLSEADRRAVRQAIRLHLNDALAPVSVSKLEAIVKACVRDSSAIGDRRWVGMKDAKDLTSRPQV